MQVVRVIILSMLLVFGMAQVCASTSDKIVAVSGHDYNIPELPVSILLADETGGAVVTSLGTGAVVPSQVECSDDGMLVSWIAEDLEKGKSKKFSIQVTERPGRVSLAGVRVRKGEEAVDVTINARPFTKYVFAGGLKPYLYPLMNPTGKSVVRSFPMLMVEGESKDHPHQRSFWFTFGDVDGIDFWAEGPTRGRVVHREFEDLVSGPVYGRIRTVNDWIDPDGRKLCEDTRELRVYRMTHGRLLDFEVTIRASEGPVKFGDTKEGMFGIRVADSMSVDRGDGTILNSHGQKNGEAWGKPAEWVDYYGTVEGDTLGIAILDHPSSFRHPTYWHVRTYGLFAANPFGLKDFTGGEIEDGSHTIPEGEEITFRYRIYIHEGPTDKARVTDVYAGYATPPSVTVK